MSLPVTVVTVAFGSPDIVMKWAQEWSGSGAACLIADNGNQLPSEAGSFARVLPYAGNDGYGQGINRAVQGSDTPIVLITNPDTLPETPNSLGKLLKCHSEGSLTAGITVDDLGREVHATGIWPTLNWVRSQVFHPAATLWRGDRTDWLQGSLIMVYRKDFLQLGGFGSSYPLYFEDVDLCFRAEESGMKVNLCRNSRFIHKEGSGSSRATASRISCYHWGLLEFFRDHDPVAAHRVKKMILAKSLLRMIGYFPVNLQASRGYFQAYRSVLTGVQPVLPMVHNG